MNSNLDLDDRCDTAPPAQPRARTVESTMLVDASSPQAPRTNIVSIAPAELDPIHAMLDEFQCAVRQWKAARRKFDRLDRALPDDVTRKPRVQIGRLIKGDGFEPRFANSEYQVIAEMNDRRDTMIATTGTPGFIYMPNGKFKRAPLTEVYKQKRAEIRSHTIKRTKELIASLREDAAGLRARQEAAGYAAAANAMRDAEQTLMRLRWKITQHRPHTAAGAAALSGFVYSAYRSATNSPDRFGPHHLREVAAATIARHVSEFLAPASHRTARVRRRPARSAA